MRGATTRHRAVTLGVLAAVLVAAASTSGAPAAHPNPGVGDLDLAASANPSAAEPVVADDAFASDAVSRRRTWKSDVTATGSAICDGCDAASTALQVLYVSRAQEARLDNTAAAWTQGCADCTATALSVQVVVLRAVAAIVPNNRALAVNAACTSCRVAGVAFQLVVSSRSNDRLSPSRWLRCGNGWPSRLQRCGRRRRPRTRQGPAGSTGRRPNGVPRKLPTPRWWISRTWSPTIWAPRPSPPTWSSAADRTSA